MPYSRGLNGRLKDLVTNVGAVDIQKQNPHVVHVDVVKNSNSVKRSSSVVINPPGFDVLNAIDESFNVLCEQNRRVYPIETRDKAAVNSDKSPSTSGSLSSMAEASSSTSHGTRLEHVRFVRFLN
ncbi:hypothetical protein L2E82_08289 [Cichorium intybus]|uniref:Uncharacterized protein n=1 Tax=Cichorium intybus TaxID=13427 RepID=A0ACB9G764_CICIN|nr:hypothetical protein L2E82_08289 [Cichorium intybus]